MAIPTNRQEFKDYCLRKVSYLQIEVSDDQVEDRIDEALQYYYDYHFDGTQKVYLKHQITQDDIDNEYVTIADDANIIGVTRIFPIGDPSMRADDIFNIRYQIALNDLYSLTSVSMIPYYATMEHLALIEQLLVGHQQVDYNRHTNIIYVRMDWSSVKVGEYLLFECYQRLDVNTSTIWTDRWLQNYAKVLIQEQWGQNLMKYQDVQMISGVRFNAARILDDAQKERAKLEDEMIYTFSLPSTDMFVG
jgi:hypothetical protein